MYIGKRAQTTLEYAVLISVVVAALIGMQFYMKKSVMGKLKESTDQTGEQFDAQNNYTVSWKTTPQDTTGKILNMSREYRERGDAVTDPVSGKVISYTMKKTKSFVNQGKDDGNYDSDGTVITGTETKRKEYEDFGTLPTAEEQKYHQ